MNSVDNYFAMKWYEKYKENHRHKGYLLWVDDLRPVPNEYRDEYHVVWARDYDEAVAELHRFRYDVICLDHDLGEGPTCYDLCKYIIAKHIYCPEYRIHTSNPVGRKNMTELLRRYTNAVIKQM